MLRVRERGLDVIFNKLTLMVLIFHTAHWIHINMYIIILTRCRINNCGRLSMEDNQVPSKASHFLYYFYTCRKTILMEKKNKKHLQTCLPVILKCVEVNSKIRSFGAEWVVAGKTGKMLMTGGGKDTVPTIRWWINFSRKKVADRGWRYKIEKLIKFISKSHESAPQNGLRKV